MHEGDDEIFTRHLPPPFPPHGGRDVVFFRHEAGGEPPPQRDDEDIMLRRVRRPIAQRFRAAAGGRGLTHAQYLAAIVALHEEIRRRADSGDAELQKLLEDLKLVTVTV